MGNTEDAVPSEGDKAAASRVRATLHIMPELQDQVRVYIASRVPKLSFSEVVALALTEYLDRRS